MLNAVEPCKSERREESLGGGAQSSPGLHITRKRTTTTMTITLASAICFHVVSVLLLLQFKPSGSTFDKFPVCQPASLSLPHYLPLIFEPIYICETLLGGTAICIVAYWTFVMEYLWEYLGHGRQNSWIRIGCTMGLVAGSMVVKDLTWMVLLVLPGVLNASLVLALSWEWELWWQQLIRGGEVGGVVYQCPAALGC